MVGELTQRRRVLFSMLTTLSHQSVPGRVKAMRARGPESSEY